MSLCEVHRFSAILKKQVGLEHHPSRNRHAAVCDALSAARAERRLHDLDAADAHRVVCQRSAADRRHAGWISRVLHQPCWRCGFARYIAEETVEYVERFFPAKASRDGRCIGGLSMGGYGALRLALGWPDRFASATRIPARSCTARANPKRPRSGSTIKSSANSLPARITT